MMRRERGHHLAAVAHAQREGVAAAEEGRELLGQHRVEEDRARPALAGAQRVAVAEAAAGDEALELVEPRAAGLQVAHVHVEGVEAGLRHRVAHLDLRVDALLAQDGELRPRVVDERRGDVLGRVEAQVQVQAGVVRRAGRGVLGVGAGRVVALRGDAPAHLVPGLVQLAQRRAEHAPWRRARPRPRRGRWACRSTWLCRLRPCSRSVAITASRSAVRHLDHHAELLVEQRLRASVRCAARRPAWPSSWSRRSRRGCRRCRRLR